MSRTDSPMFNTVIQKYTNSLSKGSVSYMHCNSIKYDAIDLNKNSKLKYINRYNSEAIHIIYFDK